MRHDALKKTRRAVRGLRAGDYGKRRIWRGATRAYAPRWTDSAADAAWKVLEQQSIAAAKSTEAAMLALLLDAKGRARYVKDVGALGTPRDGKVAAEVLAFHARKARASSTRFHACAEAWKWASWARSSPSDMEGSMRR